MTDINTDSSQNMPPTSPELHYPGGSEYRTLKTDIPLEQPMIFYLDGSQAFYLPHESTNDEHSHVLPQGVVDTLTNKRIFQEINIRQGQAGMFTAPILLVDKTGPVDMTGYMMRFEGRDSSEAEIFTDIGFNRVQANLGKITWSPEAVVAQSPGYYSNAHFVIETPDRSKILTTLDFSINVIANDVAFPRVMAFYCSEYQRALFHIKEMQTSAEHQLDYLNNMYSAIMADRISEMRITMNNALDELAADLNDGKNKIDGFISDSKAKLDQLNLGLTDANSRLDDLEKQIKADNLVTTDTLIDMVNKGIAAGQIIMDINDKISNQDTKDEVDKMYDFFTQIDSQGGNN